MSRKTAWQAWLKGLDAFLRIDPHYKFASTESEESRKQAVLGDLMQPIPFKLDTRGLDPQLHVDPELSRISRSVISFSAKLAADPDPDRDRDRDRDPEVEAEAEVSRVEKIDRAEKIEWHQHRRRHDP